MRQKIGVRLLFYTQNAIQRNRKQKNESIIGKVVLDAGNLKNILMRGSRLVRPCNGQTGEARSNNVGAAIPPTRFEKSVHRTFLHFVLYYMQRMRKEVVVCMKE